MIYRSLDGIVMVLFNVVKLDLIGQIRLKSINNIRENFSEILCTE